MDLKTKVKENLAEIKKLIFEDETPEETPVEMADVKTVSGETIRLTPAAEVGATAEVIAEDGELSPVADGEVELEDGSILTIEGGIVANMVMPEIEASEDKPAEFNAEKFAEDLTKSITDSILSTMDERLKEFVKAEVVTELDEKFTNTTKKTIELVETIAAEPVEEPTKKTHQPFKRKRNGRISLQELNKLNKK